MFDFLGFGKKPKTEAIVVDLDGVIFAGFNRFDQLLLDRLSVFQQNGLEIYVSSTGYNALVNEQMRQNGLDLDLDKSRLGGGSLKAQKAFWKDMVKSGNLPAGTVFLDDNAENCKAAKAAGLTALHWDARDPDRIKKLEQAIQP